MGALSLEKKAELTADFKKYEKYIFAILATNTHRTKTNNRKVNIYNADRLSMTDEDLIQQGRLFLWEALLNYGKFPEKAKSQNRKIASKSTFVFTHIRNMYINLGVKTVCKKYNGVSVPIEDSFDLLDVKSADDNLMSTELETVLETCKKYRKKDPEKYKEVLTDYWRGGNV